MLIYNEKCCVQVRAEVDKLLDELRQLLIGISIMQV